MLFIGLCCVPSQTVWSSFQRPGFECTSKVKQVIILNYVVYHLRAYGVHFKDQDLNVPVKWFFEMPFIGLVAVSAQTHGHTEHLGHFGDIAPLSWCRTKPRKWTFHPTIITKALVSEQYDLSIRCVQEQTMSCYVVQSELGCSQDQRIS